MLGRFTREDRLVLSFAMQEAADLGHQRLGTDHLILGMLCNARSPLFEVLGQRGLVLTDARDAVRAAHDATPDDADKTAEERYEEDREALRHIGIDLDKIRAAVADRLGDDVAQGWGERSGRRRGRGSRPGDDPYPGPHPGAECGHRGRRHHRGPRDRVGPPMGGPAPGEFGPEGFGPDGFGPEGFGPGGFGPGGFGPDVPFDGPWGRGRGRRGPHGRANRPRFTAGARQTLAAAVRIARDAGDDRLRAEHLLLGIIATGDGPGLALLESAGVDAVKADVEALLAQPAR